MRNVPLPDPLYDEALQVAESQGLSLEAFVADAVRSSLTEGDVGDDFFTPEILAEIDVAASETREGKNITMEEMRASLAARREAWLSNRAA